MHARFFPHIDVCIVVCDRIHTFGHQPRLRNRFESSARWESEHPPGPGSQFVVIAELGPDSEVAMAAREVLEKAPDPLSARQIGVRLRSRYALTEGDIMGFLAREVALGRAFRYGSAEAPRYWWGDDDAYAEALVTRQLAQKPLTAVGLHKHVAARIPAYPLAGVMRLLEHLVGEGRAHRLPGRPRERASRFSAVPPDPKDALQRCVAGFLQGLDREVVRLEAIGIGTVRSYAAARELLLGHPLFGGPCHGRPNAPGTGPGPCSESRGLTGNMLEDHILEVLRGLSRARRHGGLVAVRDLREAIGDRCPDKGAFDAALAGLARNDRLWLYRHDFPASLSPAERAGMVVDDQGNYYNGVSLRE
jgi:hypothetical protein